MEYREIEYHINEWTAYSGQEVSCFTCNDKKLFKDLGLLGVSEETDSYMKDLIDYYLDNREDLLAARSRERKAASIFYDTLSYKGD